MNRLVVLIVLTLLAWGAQAQPQPRTLDPEAQMILDLNRIESLYFKYLTPAERQEAVRLMNEARGIAVGLRGTVPTTPEPTPAPAPAPTANVLSDEGFQSLLVQVKAELSDDSKTKRILALGKKGKITCAQLEKLISVYTFDSYKERLLRAVADNILDPVNIGMVLGHIDSTFTRDDLAKFFQER